MATSKELFMVHSSVLCVQIAIQQLNPSRNLRLLCVVNIQVEMMMDRRMSLFKNQIRILTLAH